ncbi:T9SS type A sorting domain-containing protein [Dinghuibacter silviterrae]|uniref:Putative secreted protein (Por secretion system target) n=1 Tax=Dinghuibacter silviterrae TaxID=1539049 RepID=A0A4R8DXN8_9BACT|nr:T9SS type A sorting domain-containing protein [Dinghuibacter silviterrae]TDX02315.1 putative secreted protein (Por secretion system target) [Dinghuibacter silviterrae]
MYRILLCVLFVLSCALTSEAQCPAATPPAINSVAVTQSRCAASGTATVSASGGSTPYTYSITAGPVLASPQSSNIFNALSPGTYTVQVTDNCNTSVTTTFTVTGTYTVPTLSATIVNPSCPSSSDGSITLTVTNGRAPVTYALVSPSPVMVGPQAGNVFTGLPAGTYTAQVKDSCGNIQTQTVTLAAAPSSVTLVSHPYISYLQYIACDSFAVYLTFNITNYKPPYTVTATLPNGSTLTQVLTAPVVNAGSFIDTIYIRYNHVTGNTDLLPITVTNQCGVSSTGSITLSTGMDLTPDSTASSVCGKGYSYTFDNFPNLHCSTVTYSLVSPAGVVLVTQASSTFIGYTPGVGYKVIRHDCCRTDTLQFTWSVPPPFQITYSLNVAYATCKENTTSLYLTYNYNDLAYAVLVSGPPSITLANGTVYTYTYPDTAYNLYYESVIGYFGPGTYKMYVIDTQCGQKDSLTLTIGPGDVRHTIFTNTLEKGCNNANKILQSVVNNNWWTPGTVTVNSTTAQLFSQYDESSATSYSDSVQNLPAGTYYTAYQYSNIYGLTYFKGMSTWACDVDHDTIVIPPYTDPLFNTTPAIAICGVTREVALVPDTTTGVPPYQYQITAGPTTTALQSSPVFTGLAAGTYTFQMIDACDNSYSHSLSISTLAVPSVVTTGSTCVGSDVLFTLPSSPFFTYTWQYPNGTTSSGNTLALNPITTADIGTYTVSLTSTIAGCTNTTSSSFSLNSCQVLAETLLHFRGQWVNGNIQLSWQTTDETNTSYYIVERSTDGIGFMPVQQVEALGGTQNNYSVTDAHVPPGIVYYRLRIGDKRGSYSYSNIISLHSGDARSFNVYPTLITGNVPVTVTGPATSHTSYIRLISVDGKVWKNIPVAAGVTQTSIDVSGLAPGVYFVAFTGDDGVSAAKVLKE